MVLGKKGDYFSKGEMGDIFFGIKWLWVLFLWCIAMVGPGHLHSIPEKAIQTR